MEKKIKIIAVDFDGTLCENKWPEIGAANDELIEYLKKRQASGDKIILWTCRVGELLQQAVRFCYNRGLIFDAVNENLPETLEWIAKAIGKLGGIFNRKDKRYFYSINDKKHRYITLKKYDYKPVAKKNQPYQRRNY